MHNRDIIVIGASAGGVETLTQLVEALPSNLKAAIFIALHFPASSISVLPKILNRCRTLPASHAQDGEPICPNRIYIAPPNYHLILQPDRIHLSQGPRENGHRPAIDALFRSAAHTHGSRVIGVILSGMLDDGVAGIAIVKANGGLALVQDPNEALFESMPRSAIATVAIDWVLPIAELAKQLVDLSQTTSHPMSEPLSESSDPLMQEAQIVAESKSQLEQGQPPNSPPSMLTCPDCGGVLWEIQSNYLMRYRCHVGHVYSLDSLVSEQANAVETALWSAIRALEEKAALARRMAEQARTQNHALSADRFEERAEDAKKQADIVRQVIDFQSEQMLNRKH